ncbi:MAG: T9SS type A sorting domain-containing protein [Chitinophagales bacterium]|nr:T9SS type A sorting domain-containing protein [Chitinophagales bacterium]
MMFRYTFIFWASLFLLGNKAIAGSDRNNNFSTSFKQISFEENKGQIKDQHWKPRPDVLFSGSTGTMNYFLRNNGISYQFVKQEVPEEIKLLPLEERMKKINEIPTQIYRVDVNWKNTNKNFSVEKTKALDDVNNYYNMPAGVQPALNVKKYEEVWLRNVWKGVDMHYFSRDGVLESDWVLTRAADYINIAFEIKGAELSIEDGELVMKTPLGTIREGALKSFQEGKEVSTKWSVEGNTVRLQLENFNAEKPITIDPPTRAWATYYGGSGSDIVWAMSTDQLNNVIATGQTTSATAIATTGAHLTTIAGAVDVLVAKFDSTGVRQWGTYYGGTQDDIARAVSTSSSNEIVIAGYTKSNSGIATAGTFQTVYTTNNEMFVAKFSSTGVLQWGTYYGFTADDYAYGCAVSGSHVYVAGETLNGTATSLATTGAHQTVGNGNIEAILIKLNLNDGTRAWATFYGGVLADGGRSCAVDASGNVYFAGYTQSQNTTLQYHIATSGAHDTTYAGSDDGFLVKFNSAGTRLWSTYYGGGLADVIRSCVVDGSNNVYISGVTASSADITTSGSHRSGYLGSATFSEGFVAKFNASGVRQWGTYSGGNNTDEIWASAVTKNDEIMVVGETKSTANVATGDAHQGTYGGGSWDVYLNVYSADGTTLVWGTYYGGTGSDEGVAAAVDKSGNYFLGGITTSANTSNVIATNGAHQTTAGGGNDGLVAKFNRPCAVSLTPLSATICSGQSTTLTASGGVSYVWSNSLGTNASVSVSPGSTTTYTVTATDANGCSAALNAVITVNTSPTANVNPPTATHCGLQSTALTASGGGTYLWSNGGTAASFFASPGATTTYTVTVTAANGCTATASSTITVITQPTATVTPQNPAICLGQSVTLTASGGSTYSWSTGATTNGITVSPTNPSNIYNVTVSNAPNCSATAQAVVIVNANPNATISPASATICTGQSVTLTAGGGTSYSWSNGITTSNNIVSPASTTAYTVTVTANNGCTATASATVTVNSSSSASINPASASICNGQSATLTASGGGTYAWSNGSSNAAISVSPASTTTYTVTVTNGNCSATASATVTVNPVPTAGISPASATICEGQSTTLTASGGGTYAWSNSGGSNAAATFSPTTNTVYTVTVTGAGNCTATASSQVTVNALPTASISPATTSICNGQSATLTASGGGTYAWSNSGGNNATATFSPTTNATYTVTVTNAANCTATASASVTVNSLPAASVNPATASICNGTSQTLTASGGTSYSWSNALGSGASKTVSPTTTTTYTVTVTNAANCTATASSTVTVNTVTANINGPSTICSGLQATLTASGGTSYAWSNSETTASITVSPSSTTTYTVTVTGAGNCTATASQTVSVQSAPSATISGPTEVCAGETITLTANGGNTYAWSNNETTAAINVSPTTNTTYTVTVSVGVNCSATASQIVAVKQPSAFSFAETICFGDSYTFDNQTLTQSGTYTKTEVNSVGCDSVITLNLTVLPELTSSFSESICSGSSFTFNGNTLTQAGQYTEVFTSVNGCDSTVTLTLSIAAAPQITQQPSASSSSVCEGTGVSISVTATGDNLSYQWKEGNTNVGTNSSTYNTGNLTSGTKTYTVEVSNACGSETSNPVSVTVHALPNPTITQSGFTLSTQLFAAYQWQLNGNNISGATNQTHTATQNGSHTVVVTDANGCSNTSSAVNVTGVGITEVVDFRSVIYPNPATIELTVEADEMLQSIVITDIIGKTVVGQSEIFSLKSKIDVSRLAESTYFIRITTTTGKTVVKPFVKN